jgi:cyclohexyl-isocyanide hydratase
MQHRPLLEFLANQARGATWISEVCTGSLILGAAGLLQGYRATTHWRYVDCLADLGAIPVRKRVVVDRNRVTAAGVSAGIDLGLFLAGLLAGERTAQTIQLQLEYDPQPPFRCGSVDSADPDVLQALEAATEASFLERRDQIRRVGALLRGATAP